MFNISSGSGDQMANNITMSQSFPGERHCPNKAHREEKMFQISDPGCFPFICSQQVALLCNALEPSKCVWPSVHENAEQFANLPTHLLLSVMPKFKLESKDLTLQYFVLFTSTHDPST